MKKLVICFLFFLVGCSNSSYEDNAKAFIELGSSTSNKTWVYFCGLIANFLPEHMSELQVLDEIGKQLGVKFLVMIPKSRCPQFCNCLCWPHDTQQELLQTYQEITSAVKGYKVQGYIGFSNGGFFLNKLAQFAEIDKPTLSIGSGGPLFNKQGPVNEIYLLIGKKDEWHYTSAVNLYEQSKKSNLTINFIEYEDGHQIPKGILQTLICDLTNKKK